MRLGGEGMHLRWRQYAAGISRYEDGRLAAAVGIFFGVYAGFAFCFYWLMQANVVTNQGVAAYRPPPKTIVNYELPRLPPTPVDPFATRVVPEPTHKIAESGVIEPKKEIKKPEARTPRSERPVRERPNPYYSSSRSFGFRPWF